MRIAITVGDINNLKIMVGDVSSAYLEAYMQGKVCFIVGPELGPCQGHLLVIDCACMVYVRQVLVGMTA
jgi:hypothetical protein